MAIGLPRSADGTIRTPTVTTGWGRRGDPVAL